MENWLCEKLSFPKNGKKCFFNGRVQKRNLKCNFLKERVIKTWKRVFLETMHFVANKYGKMGENALYLKKMCPKIMFFGKNGIKMKFFEVKNVLFWQKMGLKMPFFWKNGLKIKVFRKNGIKMKFLVKKGLNKWKFLVKLGPKWSFLENHPPLPP